MTTTTQHTHFTRPLNSHEYRVLALHCQSHGLTYSSRQFTQAMAIDDLSPTQLEYLVKLEEAVTSDVPF